MRRSWIFGMIILFLLINSSVFSLTVEEIVKLKNAGVSEQTIRLLIDQEKERRSGVWRTQDGWIIHTSEINPQNNRFADPQQFYPFTAYPFVFPTFHR